MHTPLLQVPEGVEPPLITACEALNVGGAVHKHSAAKFWPRLIDEALASFPACTTIELAVLTAETLDPLRLDPQAELRRDIDLLMDQQLQDVIKDTLEQLAAFGPPSLVQ